MYWLNHYPVDKYLGNQLHYPPDRDLSSGESDFRMTLKKGFGKCSFFVSSANG